MERQAGKHLCGGEKEDVQEGVRDGWNGEDEAMCRPWVPYDSHAFCAVDFFFFSELKTVMSTTTGL